MGGWGWVVGYVAWSEDAPTHVHMHMHACVCMYDIIGNSQGFPQWGQPFAIEIIMFNVYMCVCACMHLHACACV